MNTQQMEAAKKAMAEWLADPRELGRVPARIECAGSFALHEMRYYIFKFKKRDIGKWMLGVCGGYEDDGPEHCGHVFSEMKEYREAAAEEDAKALVEKVRAFCMEQAEKLEEQKESGGVFVGFVLLSSAKWDKRRFLSDLKSEWGLDASEDAAGQEGADDDQLVFPVGDMNAAVSLMPAPIPNGEAEVNARNNYMWPDAEKTAKAHKAHLLVAVLGDAPLLEKGKLFVKLTACCCRQKNAAGVFASGTVFEPRFYEAFSEMLKEGGLPVFNWIWFGLYQREGGVCCYTYGMAPLFGKDEMEVLDAHAQPSDVRDFLADMVSYVLENDVTLKDGETIGFTADDKHPITRSAGVSLPGMTLKIGF